MDDLVQWLGQQLDEDERIARTATEAEGAETWTALPDSYGGVLDDTASRSLIVGYGDVMAPATATHIAAHDPARVLREIDAKRRILDECTYWHDKLAREAVDPSPVPFPALGEVLDAVTPILRALALPYADRPGYREEWRP